MTNLSECIFLDNVRTNTGFVNGKMYYDGKYYTKEEYEAAFPEPALEYVQIQLDGKQIKK
jgi:hypothetical protein